MFPFDSRWCPAGVPWCPLVFAAARLSGPVVSGPGPRQTYRVGPGARVRTRQEPAYPSDRPLPRWLRKPRPLSTGHRALVRVHPVEAAPTSFTTASHRVRGTRPGPAVIWTPARCAGLLDERARACRCGVPGVNRAVTSAITASSQVSRGSRAPTVFLMSGVSVHDTPTRLIVSMRPVIDPSSTGREPPRPPSPWSPRGERTVSGPRTRRGQVARGRPRPPGTPACATGDRPRPPRR